MIFIIFCCLDVSLVAVVFFLGWCNSDCWVLEINGVSSTIFVSLETDLYDLTFGNEPRKKVAKKKGLFDVLVVVCCLFEMPLTISVIEACV